MKTLILLSIVVILLSGCTPVQIMEGLELFHDYNR